MNTRPEPLVFHVTESCLYNPEAVRAGRRLWCAYIARRWHAGNPAAAPPRPEMYKPTS